MLFELSKHITLYIYHYYNIINRITNDFLIQKGLNNVSCYLNLFISSTIVLMYNMVHILYFLYSVLK